MKRLSNHINLRKLIIISFLVPTFLLIFSESQQIYLAKKAVRAANNDLINNQVITQTREVEHLLRDIFFKGLLTSDLSNRSQPTDVDSADKINRFTNDLQTLIEPLNTTSHINGDLIKKLKTNARKLLDGLNALQRGDAIDHREWFEMYMESVRPIVEMRVSTLFPQAPDKIGLYLQTTLLDRLQKLEQLVIHEAFLLDKALKLMDISDADSVELNLLRSDYERNRNEIDTIRQRLGHHHQFDNHSLDSLTQAMDILSSALQRFDDIRRQVYSTILLNKSANETDHFATRWREEMGTLQRLLEETEKMASEPLLYALKNNEAQNLETLFTTIGLFATMILVLITVFSLLYQRIITPIKTITYSMTQLSKGDLQVALPKKRREDEVGALIDAMAVFKSNLELLNKQYTILEIAKEAAEASEKQKAEFLASMSHEIRTPMNGVLGMIAQLEKTDLTSKQARSLKLARVSAESLLAIINDILDFSKIEAGKLTLESVEFNIRTIIDEVSATLSLTLAGKPVEIVVDCPIASSYLYGDPVRIRQIFTNLLSNAIKFTESGTITVSISLQAAQQHSDHTLVECYVEDTGIGIPFDKQATLFNSFTQVDASVTRKYGGTGLGLAIVKQLCLMMNGNIQVSSDPNKGSRFSFSLYLPTYNKSALTASILDLSGQHILIMDDNPTALNCIAQLLQEYHATVLTASQPTEAAIALKQHHTPPHFFLVDESFFSFEESLEHLLLNTLVSELGIPQACKIIPMIATQHNYDDIIESFSENGYLIKPIAASELEKVLLHATAPNQNDQTDTNNRNIDNSQNNSQNNSQDNLLDNVSNNMNQHKTIIQTLLVEDNAINQEVALGILEDIELDTFELSVEIANNGVEAIQLLTARQEPFALIFMDCQMPEMDGFECTKNIRSLAELKLHHNTPIIAMTANAMAGDKEKCLEAGMNDFIAKPIEFEIVESKVKEWLNR